MKNLFKLIRLVILHPLSKGGRLKALSRVLRWQLASRVLPEASFLLPYINEASLVMKRGMTGATGNWYSGLDEPNDMALVLHLLRPGETFVDIGANIGSYSILAAAGAKARVISLEPVPTTFVSLSRNIKINALEDQVSPLCMGLSSQAGTLRFTTSQDSVNHVLADGEVGDSVEVSVTTLDLLCADNRPVAIKIDVEGHELAVLQGAARTLESNELLAVVMEVNGSGERYGVDDTELDRTMEQHGFQAYEYSVADRKLEPAKIQGLRDGNTIFLRNITEVERRIQSASRTRLVNGWI